LYKAPKEEWGLPKIRGQGGDDRVGSTCIWAKSLSLCEIFSVSLGYVILFILSAPTFGVPYFSNAHTPGVFPYT
jgi:hypothetical protein